MATLSGSAFMGDDGYELVISGVEALAVRSVQILIVFLISFNLFLSLGGLAIHFTGFFFLGGLDKLSLQHFIRFFSLCHFALESSCVLSSTKFGVQFSALIQRLF